MKGQFEVDRGSGSTTHESHDAIPAIEPNQPGNRWEFVNDVQGLLGDNADPDPLFFVESWTQGTPAAVKNWQKRRQQQNSSERQLRVLPEFDSLGIQSAARQSESGAGNGSYGTGWSRQSFKNSPLPSQFPTSPEWAPSSVESDGSQAVVRPMSQLRACQLLGVTATSTRAQIKAAYRRLVNQSHPDRLERKTEGARRLANDRMAEINEAYRILCNGLL
jgi:DnaJ-domain-containing protein 1